MKSFKVSNTLKYRMQRPEPSVSGRLQRRNLVAYPRDCRARFSDARVGARERPLSRAREALARGDDAGRLALQGIDRVAERVEHRRRREAKMWLERVGERCSEQPEGSDECRVARGAARD